MKSDMVRRVFYQHKDLKVKNDQVLEELEKLRLKYDRLLKASKELKTKYDELRKRRKDHSDFLLTEEIEQSGAISA